jgi:hypothetical protein
MKTIYLLAVLCFVLSACSPSAEQLTSTAIAAQAQTQTAAPTFTPSPTATLAPTQTPTPNSITIAFPTAGGIAPRWMILGQPGRGVEILDEKWKYANDRWGDTYGCIDYERDTSSHIYFEQCFALTDKDLTFESQHSKFLADGFEVLEPNNNFGNVGPVTLLGKRLTGTSTKTIEFFELIGVDKYILLVELYVDTDDTAPLQTIYETQVAEIMSFVLENSLQKSHLIASPTPTALSPFQVGYYDEFAKKLITDTEASAIYLATWMGEAEGSIDGTWEALGDHAASKRKQVCRMFEDRTNADVRWVKFDNCVFAAKDFPFAGIAEYYKQPGDTVLESTHTYNNQFVVYGYNDGHTFIDGYLLDGEYIYYVSLESRTLTGDTPETVFNQTVDDFIYNVLITNVNR